MWNSYSLWISSQKVYHPDLDMIYKTSDIRCTPVAVCGGHTFCKIAATDYVFCDPNPNFGGINNVSCVDNNGFIWAWGRNIYGDIGDNSTSSRLTPVLIFGRKYFSNSYWVNTVI